jgi:hypothetical protein
MISDCQGTRMMFGPRLAIADELVDGQIDVLGYLPQQNWVRADRALPQNGV